MSIFHLFAGTYTYAVNLVFNPGEGTLGTSEAVVEVHEGGAATNPIETYNVPASDLWTDADGDFAWWNVFQLAWDGTTAELIDVNQPSGDPAPYDDDDLLRRSRAEGKGAVADDASSRHGKRQRGNDKQPRRRESGRGKNGPGTRSKRR